MAETIIASSILILLILVVRILFGKYLSKRFLFGLWVIVAVRLLILPFIAVPQGASVMEIFHQPIAELSGKADSVVFRTGESIDLQEKGTMDAPAVPSNKGGAVFSESQLPKEITAGFILAVIWAAGAFITMLTILIPLIRLAIHLHKKRQFYEKITDLPLNVFTIKGLSAPCLLWKSIYVPEAVVSMDDQYEYTKLHEITHYRHADPLWNLLRMAVLCVYWFHPLVWVAAYLSKKDSETACDEGVTARLKEEEKKKYCQVLLEIASGRSFQHDNLLVESGMAEGNVLKRIRIMTNPSRTKKGISVMVIIMLLFLSGISMKVRAAEQAQALFTEAKDYSMYPLSGHVNVTECSYLNGILYIKFSNVSDSSSLIQKNELEYYDEAGPGWVMVCRLDSREEMMHAVPPDQSDGMLPVISNIQKKQADSLVLYGNQININIPETYGSPPNGQYRMVYLLIEEDGTEEIIYEYFEINE